MWSCWYLSVNSPCGGLLVESVFSWVCHCHTQSSRTVSGSGHSATILYYYESKRNENCEKRRRGKIHNNLSLEDHTRMLLSKTGHSQPLYLTSHGFLERLCGKAQEERKSLCSQEPLFPFSCVSFSVYTLLVQEEWTNKRLWCIWFLSRMSLHEMKVSVTKAFRHWGFLCIAHI